MSTTTSFEAGAAVADPPRRNGHAAIRFTGVEKIHRTERIETVALNQIHLEVAPREFLSVMGPSGSGKSTLLNVMGLLDRPSKGQIEIDGQNVGSLSDRELAMKRNRDIGFVFQTFHLIQDLNVIDNVEIPLLYRRLPAGKRRAMAQEALERVGLSARTTHFPSQLSGGQRQRVAIARAIVGQPSILLADEPTGNLDSQMGDEIMGILEDLNQGGSTIVMVTHDQRLASKTARIVRLFDGRQVE